MPFLGTVPTMTPPYEVITELRFGKHLNTTTFNEPAGASSLKETAYHSALFTDSKTPLPLL